MILYKNMSMQNTSSVTAKAVPPSPEGKVFWHEFSNETGMNMSNYRDRIRNVREDRDLTQAEVGQLLNKSQQGYNHIEAGRAELKVDDLMKLCKFYNLSADYLIGLTNKKKSYK